MTVAGGIFLDVGTATAKRMQVGCDPQEDSSRANLNKGHSHFWVRPAVTLLPANETRLKANSKEERGRKKAERVFRWLHSIGMTANTGAGGT